MTMEFRELELPILHHRHNGTPEEPHTFGDVHVIRVILQPAVSIERKLTACEAPTVILNTNMVDAVRKPLLMMNRWM